MSRTHHSIPGSEAWDPLGQQQMDADERFRRIQATESQVHWGVQTPREASFRAHGPLTDATAQRCAPAGERVNCRVIGDR